MPRHRTNARFGAAALLALGLTGCGVSQAKYDSAVADAGKEKGRAAELDKQLAELRAETERLRSQKPGDLGPDDKTKAELEELRKQKAAADARLKTYDELVKRFRKMIDAGKLEIVVRRGQIVLALETDVLFDPGKTDIKPAGKAALAEIADAIRAVAGRRFQVAGHTDTAPIKTKEFPSNWELSTARAVVVVKLLISEGAKASVLSAAGFAEFDPVGNNMAPQGRAKNRRIEITLVPNIEELVGIAALASKEDGSKKGDAPKK